MRRGYLDFTADFARDVGLDWLPSTWKVVGSERAPQKGVVRLILENEHVADGPTGRLSCEITDTPGQRSVRLALDDKPIESTYEPVPARHTLVSDDSGHKYAVPVDRQAEWYELPVSHGDTDDVPAWALRIDGRFTFTDPQC